MGTGRGKWGEGACLRWSWGTPCLWKGEVSGPSFFSPGPSLTWLLDLAVGHLHGGWCLREGIEHGEAAISQARGGGIHHCMGTRVHHVATHSCGYRRRHDGGGQRHWKTQTHIRELIPPGSSHPAPGFQPSRSLYHVLCHQLVRSLFLCSLSTTIKPSEHNSSVLYCGTVYPSKSPSPALGPQ